MKRKQTSPDSTTIAGRIQIIRGQLTQEEFAKLLSIGRTTLIRYESGKRVPDANLLQTISLTFNVDPSWLLLGYNNIPNREQYSLEKQALLDAYDGMNDADKRALLHIGTSLAQQKPDRNAG